MYWEQPGSLIHQPLVLALPPDLSFIPRRGGVRRSLGRLPVACVHLRIVLMLVIGAALQSGERNRDSPGQPSEDVDGKRQTNPRLIRILRANSLSRGTGKRSTISIYVSAGDAGPEAGKTNPKNASLLPAYVRGRGARELASPTGSESTATLSRSALSREFTHARMRLTVRPVHHVTHGKHHLIFSHRCP